MVKALLVIVHMQWPKWCCMIGISSILVSLVHVVGRMAISTICVTVRCTIWHVLRPFCYICICYWRTVVHVLVLLFISVLYCLIFLFGLILFSFEFCICCWLLLKLNTSFNISGKSLSKVRRIFSHSDCIGCIWILYLLLIHLALVLWYLPYSLVLHVPFWC